MAQDLQALARCLINQMMILKALDVQGCTISRTSGLMGYYVVSVIHSVTGYVCTQTDWLQEEGCG